MRPSKVQYFFAQNWLSYAFVYGSVLGAAVLAVKLSGLSRLVWHDISTLGLSIVIAALGGAIGMFCSTIAGSCILGPLHQLIGRLNGAPYQPGDTVQILSNQKRDRIARVKQYDETLNIVLLDLGEETDKENSDMYSACEVCRIKEG